jgi:hypothetical protein
MSRNTLTFITLLMMTLPLQAKPSGAQAILDPTQLPPQGETLVWSPNSQSTDWNLHPSDTDEENRLPNGNNYIVGDNGVTHTY